MYKSRSYSEQSFHRNWCEHHWPDLWHGGSDELFDECFKQYCASPTPDEQPHLKTANLLKFIAHFIASIPEIVEIKYELKDVTTWEVVIGTIADDIIGELMLQLNLSKENPINLIQFKRKILPKLGLIDRTANRDEWSDEEIGNYNRFSFRNGNELLSPHEKNKRAKQFLSHMHHNKPQQKTAARGTMKTDDVVSYTRVFQDLLIFYPIGRLLQASHMRRRKFLQLRSK